MGLGDWIKTVDLGNTTKGNISVSSNYAYLGDNSWNIHRYNKAFTSSTSSVLKDAADSASIALFHVGWTGTGIAVASDDSYAYVTIKRVNTDPQDRGVYKVPLTGIGSGDLTATNIVSMGSSVSQLVSPHGLYLDTNNYVYVTDRDGYKVVVVDTNGNYITHFGGVQGSGSTEFDYPYSITKIGDYLYIADTNNQRVAIWKIISYSPFQVSTTNYIISMAGYGDGKPRSIASYSNQIYVTTDTKLVIFKIESDGVTYTHKLTVDLPTYVSGYVAHYGNGVAADANNIYVTTYQSSNAAYTKLIVFDNALETYADIYITQPQIDSESSANGVNEDILFSLYEVSSLGENIPFTIDVQGWWQLNQFDQSFDLTIDAEGGVYSMIAEFDFTLLIDSPGMHAEVPFSITSGATGLAEDVSQFSLTGQILRSVDGEVDVTIEDFATLTVATPFVVDMNLELQKLEISSTTLGEILVSGTLTLETLLSAEGRSGLRGDLSTSVFGVTSHAYSDLAANGVVRLQALDAETHGYVSPVATGNIKLPVVDMDASTVTIPKVVGVVSIGSLKTVSHAVMSPVISATLDLTLSCASSGYISPDITAVLTLPILKGVYGFARQDVSKTPIPIQLVTLPIRSVSTYDINADSIVYIDGILYLVLSDGLYKIESGSIDSAEVAITLPSVDIDFGKIKKRIDLFLTTPKLTSDITATITTEGSGTTYTYSTESLKRRDGEVRVRFGKGLKSKGRYKKMRFTTTGDIEIDSIRLMETMRRGER
jgi:DNA-binding beta-propeller fold protein YncE